MEQEIINKDKVALQETGRVLDLIRRFISNGDAGTKALEMINVGILAYDHDLTISYANDALCILTGREKEDLVGVSVMDVFGETGEEDYTGKVLAEHRAGKSYQYEINTIGKGGKATLLGSGTPLLDERGTFDGGIVFYIDISERKAIEREFRGLKYFNESIVENIPSGIIVSPFCAKRDSFSKSSRSSTRGGFDRSMTSSTPTAGKNA
jgi:PAS domain S-box-containing protein